MLEEVFVNGINGEDSAEILNWYRNLYHCESTTTERGIMARAINDILPKYVSQKAEIDILIRKKDSLRDEIAEQQAEIERLNENYSNLIIEKDEMFLEAETLIKKAKSKAIKEFAEQYEKAILSLLTSATLEKKEGIYACLDRLKEMTEVSEK